MRRAACLVLIFTCLSWFEAPSMLVAQTGSIHEPVRYVGGPVVDANAHDGRLRPAVGVETFQVMRANRSQPKLADDFGWTYNHAPMIVYWNGRFFIEYLSNPVGEHIAPGQSLVCSSSDGRRWSRPKVSFPIYTLRPPDKPGAAMMHQRMGFYTAPDGRLLVLAFYGHAPDPFGPGGIGRVVREIYKDGSFGPIYFLRYNSRSGWGESNTGFPFYKRSDDKGFVAACDALLANRLMREQWWDEERFDGDFFSVRFPGSSDPHHWADREAFNWFHRKDGKIVGLWKWSEAALSSDEGKTWSVPVKCPTLQMTGAKISGRETTDGRYALVYNPNLDDDHRWPLAIVTGTDGILFDHMLCIQGEVPPRRFAGKFKDFGSQYNRCVEEGNGRTPGRDLWVTYSINKEDIWVTRVPVPVHDWVDGPVNDTFDNLKAGGPVTDWNTYSPRWALVSVVDFPGVENRSRPANKCLELADEDPYDYARAIRVFPESKKATLNFKVHAAQNRAGRLEIEVTDRFGYRPVRLIFAEDGHLQFLNGAEFAILAPYQADKWYNVGLKVDVANGRFDVFLDGKPAKRAAVFSESVKTVERISFRTGPYRERPNFKASTDADRSPDLTNPNPDVPAPLATFHIDDVTIAP